ncbi:MAG: hypothetical protein V4695_08935 [Pseudomonadota bacterium]
MAENPMLATEIWLGVMDDRTSFALIALAQPADLVAIGLRFFSSKVMCLLVVYHSK